MSINIDLIQASNDTQTPNQSDFQLWAQTALSALENIPANSDFELSIRLIDEEESATLNENYRQKKGATNILSFPFDGFQVDEIIFLGDLAICAPVVKRESQEQSKTLLAHWAHMTIHGVLHLNAYDHENQEDAEIMEKLEISILNTLGFSNPYQ